MEILRLMVTNLVTEMVILKGIYWVKLRLMATNLGTEMVTNWVTVMVILMDLNLVMVMLLPTVVVHLHYCLNPNKYHHYPD